MSPWASRVLAFGLGALLLQAAIIIVDVVIRHRHPFVPRGT